MKIAARNIIQLAFERMRRPEPRGDATLQFGSSDALTLGVELELQVLDAKSLALAPRADEVL